MEHVYSNLVLLGSAVLQSVAGFGFNLIAVPLLALMGPVKTIVPAVLMVWIPVGLGLTWQARREVDRTRLPLLLLGGLMGLPIGAMLLKGLPDELTKRVVGGVTVGLALLLIVGLRWRLQREKPATFIIAVIAGVLGGASAMSGPPLVLLGLNQGWDPRSFRADLIAFFTFLSLCSLPVNAYLGLLTVDAATLAVTVVPGTALGYALGAWLHRRTSPEAYRKVAFTAIVIAGLLPLLLPS